MKKRQMIAAVMAMIMAVALCACSGSKTTEDSNKGTNKEESSSNTLSEGTPVSGGRVVFGMTQTLTSLDPHVETDAGTRDMVFNLYEGLVKPASDGDLVPAVASDVDISDDAKVYTFTLRDGITFHDGTAVTVEDVKYSIDRYAEIQGESSAFSIVSDVTIADEKTIVVTLKESYSEFLSLMVLAIIPQANEDITGNPIGTGPFKLASYSPGENIVLEKYEGYWKEGYPYLDQVEFKFIADVDTAFVELQAGTIDMMKYLTTDQVAALDDTYTIYEGNMNLVHGMFFNHAYEPLANQKVRQALCYAIDRDSVNQFLFGGKSKLIGSHMIPTLGKYYEENAENIYSYDPAKAKELLSEAGYADGFDLEITVASSYSQHVKTAEIIVEQLSQVGINATVKKVEWGTWLEEVYQGGKFQSTVIGFDGTLMPGDFIMRYKSDSSKNFMHYANEEFDRVFNEAYETVDDDKKVELYKKAQMILAEDAAAVYIEDPANLVAVNKKFAGYTFYPTSAEDMSLVYMVK